MYEYAWLVMNFFAAAACVNYKQIPYIYIYIYTEYGSHTFIIKLPHAAGMKNSHNADFTLVLLKIFDVHLVFLPFSQNLLFDNIAILREVSRKKYQT